MKTLRLPAKALQIARHFQAKQDSRTYLNGVSVRKNNRIYATNGHKLARVILDSQWDLGLTEDIIVNIHGATFPKKAETAILSWNDDDKIGLVEFRDLRGVSVHKQGTPDLRTFSIIKGNAPDFERVMSRNSNEEQSTTSGIFGVNASYISDISSALRAVGRVDPVIKITSSGENNLIRIEPVAHKINLGAEVLFVIMPCRL